MGIRRDHQYRADADGDWHTMGSEIADVMEPHPVILSHDELAVLRLVSLGWSTTAIADKLGFQYNTVNRIMNRMTDRIWPHGFSSDRHRRVMLVLFYQRFYEGC